MRAILFSTIIFSILIASPAYAQIGSQINGLPEWMSPTKPQWVAPSSINVSWNNLTQNLPECYLLNWSVTEIGSSPVMWSAFLNSTGGACLNPNQLWAAFNESGILQENRTYWFNITAARAGDTDGGAPSLRVTSTSMDTASPQITANIINLTGDPVGPIVSGGMQASLFSQASDDISGIANITLAVWTTELNKLSKKDVVCTTATCTTQVTVGQDTQIRFSASVIDRAGNTNTTSWLFIGTHPLSNFISHDLQMTFGDISDVQIQVRNLQQSPDNITIRLDPNSYSLARFASGQGSYAISSNGMALNVTNIAPDEERIFTLEILTTNVGDYALTMNATSNLTGQNDTDSLRILITNPVAFPALSEPAILITILSAAGLFALARKGFKPALQHSLCQPSPCQFSQL